MTPNDLVLCGLTTVMLHVSSFDDLHSTHARADSVAKLHNVSEWPSFKYAIKQHLMLLLLLLLPLLLR
jgi:hypothetical protein